MGEVYRAHDTRLGRDVALKILPGAVASDPDRLARFEREARTLATLNHPGIAQIYGFERGAPLDGARGAVSESRTALVMELVAGEDLAQRLLRGPLPWDEARSLAQSIAAALEYAHDHGVVHRDLKPANVKVTPDGEVKILDFGLAKALAPDPAATDVMNSPTLTAPGFAQGFGGAGTELGVILGTAAYMAPEQARGRPVDRRADIWAFGVLFVEMLTARRIFDGETASDIVAAVLTRPIDLGALPRELPPRVRDLIARCLDRDPKQRLRDIGEARITLASPEAGVHTPQAPATARTRPWRWLLAGVAAGLLIAAGVWAMVPGSGGAAASPTVPAFTFRQLTNLPGAEMQPDISADGRQILYTSASSGNKDLYLLRVGGARAIPLTANSPADDRQGQFSPSGDQIVFRSERDGGGVFVMGATGESVRRVTSAGYDPAWSPDGRTVAYTTEEVEDPYSRITVSELWTVDVTSGKSERLYTGDAVQASWSPGGHRIAFWANTRGQRDIWTIAATGGAPVAVTSDGATDWSPEWSPDGRWLYFVSDRGGSMNLWRIGIDERSGAPRGSAQPVTSGVRSVGYARFAADGARMVLAGFDLSLDLTVTTLDIARPDPVVPRAKLRNQSLHWCSPDASGSWLACSTRGAQEDLVLLRPDGSETRRLTDDAAKDRIAFWSPDGKVLAFSSTRSGGWEIWSIRVDGSDLRQLTQLGADALAGAWSPDGLRLMVGSTASRQNWQVNPVQLTTRATAVERPLKLADGSSFDVASWSTGDLIAGGVNNSSGILVGYGVWDLSTESLRTWPVPPTRWMGWPSWLPGSRRFAGCASDGLHVIDAVDGSSRVFPIGPRDVCWFSPDGRTMTIEDEIVESDLWLIEFAK
jgi:Tol biopolymer transport system component